MAEAVAVAWHPEKRGRNPGSKNQAQKRGRKAVTQAECRPEKIKMQVHPPAQTRKRI